jgi:hypothetical protein
VPGKDELPVFFSRDSSFNTRFVIVLVALF